VAQDGGEAAFSVLWRDVNPVLLRYLRVAAPGAAEDVAAETWVQVIRGLAGFCGDDGRGGHGCSRLPARRAIDEGRRRSRRLVASLAELTGGREPRTADATRTSRRTAAPGRRRRPFRNLEAAAGGTTSVTAYCAAAAHPAAAPGRKPISHPGGKPASTPAGKPTSAPAGKPTSAPAGKPTSHPGKPTGTP
jgi:hypothetical protein